MIPKKTPQLLCLVIIALLPPRLAFCQSAEIPSPPAPTPGTRLIHPGPIAQITMEDGTGVTVKLRGVYSPRVLLRADRPATIVLQYDEAKAGQSLDASPMDGGVAIFPGNRTSVGPNGQVLFQFRDAHEPGLYRLRLNCGETSAIMQFWVPSPEDPRTDASIVVPRIPPVPRDS